MPEDTLPSAALIANVHKELFNIIEFSKKQQWQITNYVVLIYAAVFGIARAFKDLSILEKQLLTLIALAAAVMSIVLLSIIQRNMGRYRLRLESIHNKWLSEEDRDILGIKPYTHPIGRGGLFLAALIGVTVIGFIFVAYSLWR